MHLCLSLHVQVEAVLLSLWHDMAFNPCPPADNTNAISLLGAGGLAPGHSRSAPTTPNGHAYPRPASARPWMAGASIGRGNGDNEPFNPSGNAPDYGQGLQHGYSASVPSSPHANGQSGAMPSTQWVADPWRKNASLAHSAMRTSHGPRAPGASLQWAWDGSQGQGSGSAGQHQPGSRMGGNGGGSGALTASHNPKGGRPLQLDVSHTLEDEQLGSPGGCQCM